MIHAVMFENHKCVSSRLNDVILCVCECVCVDPDKFDVT